MSFSHNSIPVRICIYTVFASLALMAGCASPPHSALQGARRAVAEAYINEAYQLAPQEYKAAREALQEGERLVHQGHYKRAEEVLTFAESHARRAQLRARETQAKIEEEQLRQQQARLEKERLKASSPPKVSQPVNERSKPPEPSPPPPPKPKTKPKVKVEATTEPTTHYTVADGETLWTIAARSNVYQDALLWPIIYKANRDQIKDPRQIYPGQILNIPRDLSTDEKEEARNIARQSDIFPLQELLKSRSSESPRNK